MKGSNFILPEWPAPKQVAALVTTRLGGVSKTPYESFNLAAHVGDEADVVIANRAVLQSKLGTVHQPQWLDQVHGTAAVEAARDGLVKQADVVFTSELELPCAVLTADCLPVFFCNLSGSRVAVAHAGWRGLAKGVLAETVAKFDQPNDQLMAWLGPAIGPKKFEVGAEVREIFLRSSELMEQAFTPNEENPNHWFADLYLLAKTKLEQLGIEQISGGGYCTFSEHERFYSYRRDGKTGRMASLIWLKKT